MRIWEFTGRVRRGYFVRGLSGAQFIKQEEYEGVLQALKQPKQQIVWINAADPMQPWGKVLEHLEGRSFLNIPGTAVCLKGGVPVMLLERQGKVLRVLEENNPEMALKEFVHLFREKAIFPEKNRIVIQEYPAEIREALKTAGFRREVKGYSLYR